MENENIGQAPIPTPVADQNLPPIQPPQTNSKRLIVLIILFIVIAIVGIGAYTLGAKTQPTLTTNPTPIAVTQPTPTPDPTANWKTYENPIIHFLFKYPEEKFQYFAPPRETQGSLDLYIAPSLGRSGEENGTPLALGQDDVWLGISVVKTFNSLEEEMATPEVSSIIGTGVRQSVKIGTENGYEIERLGYGSQGVGSIFAVFKHDIYFYRISLNAFRKEPLELNKGLFDQILSTFKFLD